MVGIYKITNLFTGETYIGQSKNVDERIRSHKNRNKPNFNSTSKIEEVILDEGKDNFSYELLEECSEKDLDKREDYWILYYHSNEDGFGYNKIRGGQHNVGESNSNCKLTEKEVYDIREAYNNHENKYDVYEKYKHKITKYYFSNLWEGRSWYNIHYDVYTKENIDYYMKGTSIGENGAFAAFSDKEVLELRKRYVNESAKQIYESVKDRCGFQTLQQILWGRHYNHIPIYDKKHKVWTNN